MEGEAIREDQVTGIKRFEDIQAWQEARELTRMVYNTSDEDKELDQRIHPLPERRPKTQRRT